MIKWVCVSPSASCCLAHPVCLTPLAHSRPYASLASLALIPSVSYSLSGWNGPEWVHSGRLGSSEWERMRTGGAGDEEGSELCLASSHSLPWLLLLAVCVCVCVSPSPCLACLLLLELSVSFCLQLNPPLGHAQKIEL